MCAHVHTLSGVRLEVHEQGHYTLQCSVPSPTLSGLFGCLLMVYFTPESKDHPLFLLTNISYILLSFTSFTIYFYCLPALSLSLSVYLCLFLSIISLSYPIPSYPCICTAPSLPPSLPPSPSPPPPLPPPSLPSISLTMEARSLVSPYTTSAVRPDTTLEMHFCASTAKIWSMESDSSKSCKSDRHLTVSLKIRFSLFACPRKACTCLARWCRSGPIELLAIAPEPRSLRFRSMVTPRPDTAPQRNGGRRQGERRCVHAPLAAVVCLGCGLVEHFPSYAQYSVETRVSMSFFTFPGS